MQRYIRIIPRLDIKGPNLVKGVHLEGLRVLGKPEEFARQYYREGADELIYIDIVASLYNRNNLLPIVERTARELFIPLTVGGGLRNIDDIRRVLRAGADKVALNTAAIRSPQLIREAAQTFGSSTIVVSIEAIRQPDGTYLAYTDNGREPTGKNVVDWARQAEQLGGGEILLTSVDRDGTGEGFDLELIKTVTAKVAIPVIACAGAGRPGDFLEAIKNAKADCVSAASLFHYHYLEECVEAGKFKEEGNIEFLKRARQGPAYLNNKLTPVSIKELKTFLVEKGICCRMAQNIAYEYA